MRGKIEQNGAHSPPAQIIGKGAHECCFTGPPMHQQHASGIACLRLETIRLKFTDTRHQTSSLRRA